MGASRSNPPIEISEASAEVSETQAAQEAIAAELAEARTEIELAADKAYALSLIEQGSEGGALGTPITVIQRGGAEVELPATQEVKISGPCFRYGTAKTYHVRVIDLHDSSNILGIIEARTLGTLLMPEPEPIEVPSVEVTKDQVRALLKQTFTPKHQIGVFRGKDKPPKRLPHGEVTVRSLFQYEGEYYVRLYNQSGTYLGAALAGEFVASLPPDVFPIPEPIPDPIEPVPPNDLPTPPPAPPVGSVDDLPPDTDSPDQPEPRPSESEGTSAEFEDNFTSGHYTRELFGFKLKNVTRTRLRMILKTGIENFFILHNRNLREIEYNPTVSGEFQGRRYTGEFVYAGTQTRAKIYNGDMLFENYEKYQAHQAQTREQQTESEAALENAILELEQGVLQNEEEKYAEYPLNGLIYLPYFKFNGKTVLKFTDGTRTKYVNQSILRDLIGLAIDFHKRTGQPLILSSVYRTYSHQAELRRKYGSGRAASPGNSKHNVAIAVDINNASRSHFSSHSAFDRFVANHGFDRPLSHEPWHFEHIASKQERARSGYSRPQVSRMLDDIDLLAGKREHYRVTAINPILFQALEEGMAVDSLSYRMLYKNLYKILAIDSNINLSLNAFEILCRKELQRQKDLDRRGVLPRIVSRPQRTLQFDTDDIRFSKKRDFIITDNYAFIKPKVGSSESLRDFIEGGYEVLQLLDRNGSLVTLNWNAAKNTYEHNGRHYPINGGETILLHPVDESFVPEFTFYERMPVGTFLRTNPEWFHYQLQRLNEKWGKWFNQKHGLNPLYNFHPLTIYDIYGIVYCESAGNGRLKHKGGRHSQGEAGMLPLPKVLRSEWLSGVDGNAPLANVETKDVRENILAMMEYLLAIKNKPAHRTKYHRTLRGYKGHHLKEARYIAAVIHARGNDKNVIKNIHSSSTINGYLGYSGWKTRQTHMNRGFAIADEVAHMFGTSEGTSHTHVELPAQPRVDTSELEQPGVVDTEPVLIPPRISEHKSDMTDLESSSISLEELIKHGSTPNGTQYKVANVPRTGPDGKKRYASDRYNNPGAQWPLERFHLYGCTGHGILKAWGETNQIARFENKISGAAACMDALKTLYGGMSAQEAIDRWRGEYHHDRIKGGGEPIPKTLQKYGVVSEAFLNNKEDMISFWQEMLAHEGTHNMMSRTDLGVAFDIFQAEGIDNYVTQYRTNSEMYS